MTRSILHAIRRISTCGTVAATRLRGGGWSGRGGIWRLSIG